MTSVQYTGTQRSSRATGVSGQTFVLWLWFKPGSTFFTNNFSWGAGFANGIGSPGVLGIDSNENGAGTLCVFGFDGGFQAVTVSSGSNTSWQGIAVVHVGGTNAFDVYHRLEGDTVMTLAGTINISTEIPFNVAFAGDFGFGDPTDSAIRGFGIHVGSTLTAAQIFTKLQTFATYDGTADHTFLPQLTGATAGTNDGTAGAYTVTGTPTTESSQPALGGGVASFLDDLPPVRARTSFPSRPRDTWNLTALAAPELLPFFPVQLPVKAGPPRPEIPPEPTWNLAPLSAVTLSSDVTWAVLPPVQASPGSDPKRVPPPESLPALPPPVLTSIGWMDSRPARAPLPAERLRIVSGSSTPDLQPPPIAPFFDESLPVRARVEATRRPLQQLWSLAALVPVAVGSLVLDAPPARAAPAPSQRSLNEAPLPPLEPFPSQAFIPPAGPPPRSLPTPVARASTNLLENPLEPFPSATYLPEASAARGNPPVRAPLPGSAVPVGSPIVASLGPSFDFAPPPQQRRSLSSKPAYPADPTLLTALPFVVSAWSDFAPPPQQRRSSTRGAFPADPTILPAIVLSPLAAFAELAPPPARARTPLPNRAFTEQQLAPLLISPWLPEASAPRRSKPEAARFVSAEQSLPPLPFVSSWLPQAAPPPRASVVPPPPRDATAQPVGTFLQWPALADAPLQARREPLRLQLPSAQVLPPLVPASSWTPDASLPARARSSASRAMLADSFLPAPGTFIPPTVWNEFALPPVRARLVPTRAPAPEPWFVTNPYAPVITPIQAPFLSAGSQFFPFRVLRRPDQIAALLPPGSSAPLLWFGGEDGRLLLSPLPDRDPRQQALLVLQKFITLLTFRRTIAPGEADGRAFRLSLAQVATEQPDDTVAMNLPSIGFLPIPGPGIHDSLGLGGLSFLEETLGVYGPNTVVVRYGEYIESFTLEVLAAKNAHRRGLVAGLQAALRLNETSNSLRLQLPEYFNAVADFALTDTQYIDDPYAVQNRRRAHLRVTLTVPDLWLVQGVTTLQPELLLEIGAAIQLQAQSSLEQLAPELSPELLAQLTRGY